VTKRTVQGARRKVQGAGRNAWIRDLGKEGTVEMSNRRIMNAERRMLEGVSDQHSAFDIHHSTFPLFNIQYSAVIIRRLKSPVSVWFYSANFKLKITAPPCQRFSGPESGFSGREVDCAAKAEQDGEYSLSFSQCR